MKNYVLGIALLVAGFFLMMQQSVQQVQRQAQPPADQAQGTQANATDTTAATSPGSQAAASPAGATPAPTASSGSGLDSLPPTIAPEEDEGEEQTHTIENDFIRVTFTSRGAAIQSVELIGQDPNGKLLYPETVEGEKPYPFTRYNAQASLTLGFLDKTNISDLSPKAFTRNFTRYDDPDYDIAFYYHLNPGRQDGLVIIRRYRLKEAEEGADADKAPFPYTIEHITTFQNKGEAGARLTHYGFRDEQVFFQLGSMPPTAGSYMSQDLNFVYFDAAQDDEEFINVNEFRQTSGFMGIGAHGALPYLRVPEGEMVANFNWAAVKNQFFTAVLTPKERVATSAWVSALPMDKPVAGDPDKDKAITGAVAFPLTVPDAGERFDLTMDFYVGPKEYVRLKDLGQQQDRIMDFGWGPFGFMAKILLVALKAIHSLLIHVAADWAWGLTIILLTVLIKGALWPLTAAQVRSSRKMQAIQEPLKEIREKLKDNPQKLQQETFRLFRENKVNPAAGCLPLLVQIPIFIGLFFMLRTTSELRFAEFLWINDLSTPDVVSWLPSIPEWVPIFSGPIHILPFIMGISMYFQMKMMPTPTTDNMAFKVMKFMPLIFFIFSYQFPSGLVLYWTVQNLLTILQTYITRQKPEDAVVITAEPAPKKGARKKGKGGGGKRK